jgi:hypothetical protein
MVSERWTRPSTDHGSRSLREARRPVRAAAIRPGGTTPAATSEAARGSALQSQGAAARFRETARGPCARAATACRRRHASPPRPLAGRFGVGGIVRRRPGERRAGGRRGRQVGVPCGASLPVPHRFLDQGDDRIQANHRQES